jgi:hypothetical protein
MYIRPFEVLAASSTLAVLATTANVAITGSGNSVRAVRLVNSGTQVIFLKFGVAATEATVATGFPMLANTVETFLLRPDITHVAAIAAATGSTLYVTVGEGA